MRNLPPDYEEDIPLGHAIFIINELGMGAEMIPDLMTFQVDGKLFDAEKFDSELLDEELLSSLNHLRDLLRAKTDEDRQS